MHPCSWVLFESATVLHLVRKVPYFCGIKMLITVHKRTRHISISGASWIHSTFFHLLLFKSLLKFSFHIHRCLPSGIVTKTLHVFLISPILVTFAAPSVYVWFDHPDIILRGGVPIVNLVRLCYLIQPHLRPASWVKIIFVTLFSFTLSLCSSFSVTQ